jgi:peptide/nickel transport system substrate-binding protein
MMRPLTVLLTGLAFLPLHHACAEPARPVLHVGLQDDPDTLDPAKNWSFVGRVVLASLCDKLVDIAPDQSFVPQLALTWATLADGKALILTLRPGVVFHDGEPFDAAAVKYNIDRELTLPDSRRRSEINAVTSVDVVAPLIVRLNLGAPFAPLLAQLSDRAGMMVSPKAAEAGGAEFGNHPVCAGPYKFHDRTTQDHVTLEKFDRYWDTDRFTYGRVTYHTIPDATVRLANLQSGQLDLIERVSPNDLPALAADKRFRTASIISLGYTGITFNVANGPAADNPFGRDARLREALDKAIDRPVINQVVFTGESPAGNQATPPGGPYYDARFPVPPRDLAAAKALVAASGVTAPTLELLVANNPEQQQVATVIQSMAKEAGIELKLKSIEFITMLAQAKEGNFQADQVGWSGRIDPDGNISTLLSCGSAGNDGHYCNQEFEALLAGARQTVDQAERQKLYAAATAISQSERPILYLYHQKWIYAFTARLDGFVPYPDGIIRLGGTRLKPAS